MKAIKIQIKNRWTDSVIFEYEKVDNTVKDTVEEAVKSGAELLGADLHDADLRGAHLRGADLNSADLRHAGLQGADLRSANLRYANLCGAYLHGAYMSIANLYGAYLRDVDLRGADLHGAYLRNVDLRGADLYDADLSGADLCNTDLRDAKNTPYVPLECPSDGAFVGWKKVNGLLVKLQIPEDAKRSSAATSKCRCDKAMVLEITSLDGVQQFQETVNTNYDQEVKYKVGEMVLPDSFDNNRWNECSHGIHFFINKQDAINYIN